MYEILRTLGHVFACEGEFLRAERVESGHIHDTWIATYRAAGDGSEFRLVHQRLNEHVFRDLGALMDNVVRVTRHLRHELGHRGLPDLGRRCLRPVLARHGGALHVDVEGRSWRTFHAIEGARTVDSVERPEQAHEAARAFGEFTALLDDLGPPPLAVTIPHFHDLSRRFAALEKALGEDVRGRASRVRSEAAACEQGFSSVHEDLERGGAFALPRRVVHHDCKVNNVMLDDRTGEGLCVIDLDTVMQGNVLSDFGELVRTTTCPAPEDERDLRRIGVDMRLFEAVARGYLAGAAGLLVGAELRLLPLAGPMFALMNAMRFLTDHLQGDVYFRVHREGHNLDRARAQLRLFECMTAAMPRLRAILDAAVEQEACGAGGRLY